jgi:hypothetical protein
VTKHSIVSRPYISIQASIQWTAGFPAEHTCTFAAVYCLDENQSVGQQRAPVAIGALVSVNTALNIIQGQQFDSIRRTNRPVQCRVRQSGDLFGLIRPFTNNRIACVFLNPYRGKTLGRRNLQ